MATRNSSQLSNYVCVTAAYWGFTLTDGALRMLVLLHFNALGYSPLDLAFLFLLYEAAGIVTNLAGGWIGARYGLRLTLFLGLATQIVALTMLSLLDPAWTMGISVAYVMAAQALSGVAKDLTKMSSKSAVKLVVPPGSSSRLFAWVALLTGSKNALKGLGFFVGGALLAALGFQQALWAMAGALLLVLLGSLLYLAGSLGKAKQKVRVSQLFSQTAEINLLSAARLFLFASRDAWFVVGVPLFLSSGLGWSFAQTGGFMASWVIFYGIVQAAAPKLIGRADAVRATRIWGLALVLLPVAIALMLETGTSPVLSILVGLGLFALFFAINSALHSYLILAYSDSDKVTLNVGFYYMANAAGRLAGTLLSGIGYQIGGLSACLWISGGLVLVAALLTLLLPPVASSPSIPLATAD